MQVAFFPKVHAAAALLIFTRVVSSTCEATRAHIGATPEPSHTRIAVPTTWRRHTLQQRHHGAVLAEWECLYGKLQALELHPALVEGSRTHVADLLPRGKVEAWAATCREVHGSLGAKVMECKM